jgi:hypothetical protein
MTLKKVPPFIASPNNSACGPAVLAMIIKHFEPEWQLNWPEVYDMCGCKEGEWTEAWVSATAMIARGYDIKIYHDVPHQNYAYDYRAVIKLKFGEDFLQASETHSNIDFIQSEMRKLDQLDKNSFCWQANFASKENLLADLAAGFLPKMWVNSSVLNHRPDFPLHGHYVLPYFYNAARDVLRLHNPGSYFEDTGPYNQNQGQGTTMGHLQQSSGITGFDCMMFRLNKY